MSLLYDKMEDFVRVTSVLTPDGYGGSYTEYIDGDTIAAALVFNNSLATQVAMANGVKSVFQIITSRDVVLRFHELLRRVSDGRYFRITTDSRDNYTPAAATLDMRVVSAEEWRMS